jgi:hypothetical protein
MNNRHQRRRAAKLTDFRAAGTLEILAPDRVVAMAAADRMFADSLFGWIASIPSNRPLCATCNATFQRDHMPALFHLIRPPRGPALLAGSCEGCASRFPSDAALMQAIIAGYGRATGARLRMADPANFHAKGGRA